jgi:hypothetical protein
MRNAPKTVRHISEELHILTTILLEIQKDAELQNSLRHCGKRLDELLVFIKNIDPAQYTRRRRRLESQCQVCTEALRSSEIPCPVGSLQVDACSGL